jgi:acetyl-CoA synthetase
MNLCNNLAYLCVRKPCELGLGDRVAYKWIHNDLSDENFTYRQIDEASNRIANVLKTRGVVRGQRVSIFLPKSSDLIESFLGILKTEAVSCILFRRSARLPCTTACRTVKRVSLSPSSAC